MWNERHKYLGKIYKRRRSIRRSMKKYNDNLRAVTVKDRLAKLPYKRKKRS